MTEPKVFGDGVLTICLNADRQDLYVGTNKIGYCEKIEIKDGEVAVKFPDMKSLEIEENVRLVKTLNFIKVNI